MEVAAKKGEVYIGSCPSGIEMKVRIKSFLESKNYIVVDLGAFDIEEKIACDVLAREVSEKVVEGVVLDVKKDEQVFGILFDADNSEIVEVANETEDIKAKWINERGDLDDSLNVLSFKLGMDIDLIESILQEFLQN